MTKPLEIKSYDHDYTPPYADKLYKDCLDETATPTINERGEEINLMKRDYFKYGSTHFGLAKLKMMSVHTSEVITQNIHLATIVERLGEISNNINKLNLNKELK